MTPRRSGANFLPYAALPAFPACTLLLWHAPLPLPLPLPVLLTLSMCLIAICYLLPTLLRSPPACPAPAWAHIAEMPAHIFRTFAAKQLQNFDNTIERGLVAHKLFGSNTCEAIHVASGQVGGLPGLPKGCPRGA